MAFIEKAYCTNCKKVTNVDLVSETETKSTCWCPTCGRLCEVSRSRYTKTNKTE